jgi:hypothetical protein
VKINKRNVKLSNILTKACQDGELTTEELCDIERDVTLGEHTRANPHADYYRGVAEAHKLALVMGGNPQGRTDRQNFILLERQLWQMAQGHVSVPELVIIGWRQRWPKFNNANADIWSAHFYDDISYCMDMAAEYAAHGAIVEMIYGFKSLTKDTVR